MWRRRTGGVSLMRARMSRNGAPFISDSRSSGRGKQHVAFWLADGEKKNPQNREFEEFELRCLMMSLRPLGGEWGLFVSAAPIASIGMHSNHFVVTRKQRAADHQV